MNFNQYLTLFCITLFLIPACYGMEIKQEAKNQALAKLSGHINDEISILNSIPRELVDHIAHFLIESSNALISMRNLSRFARTSKLNCQIIMNLPGLAELKNIARRQMKDRLYMEQEQIALLSSNSWKNWN